MGLLLLIYSCYTTCASPSLLPFPALQPFNGREAEEYGAGGLFSEAPLQIQGRKGPAVYKPVTLLRKGFKAMVFHPSNLPI